MLHVRKTKNKVLILEVNQRPVREGRKIASDKSAFLYAFAIITADYRAKRSYSWHLRCVICFHKSAKNL